MARAKTTIHREYRMVPVDLIRPNPGNARTHPDAQIALIADSIEAFGVTSPILVNESLEILAGHGRHAAAKRVGLVEAPVVVITGLSKARQRALALADNKIAERAGWDRDRLALD